MSLLLNKSRGKIKKILLDLLLPKKCFGCRQPDTYLCRACFNKIEINPNNTCFFCGKITWQGKICIKCQKQTGLDRIIAATEYKNPLIRDLIKNFKYHYVRELTKPLTQFLIKSLAQCGILDFPHKAIVLPVPLYKTRVRARGFNQAELLAKGIAKHLNLAFKSNILKRIIPNQPQAKFRDDYEKRKKNIKGVFAINPEQPIEGKTIILVDDVATTGATLIEAAKILKKSSANEVWGLVVAKGK